MMMFFGFYPPVHEKVTGVLRSEQSQTRLGVAFVAEIFCVASDDASDFFNVMLTC